MQKSSVITEEFKAIQAALEVLEPLDETQRQFAISMILVRLGMGAPAGTAGSVQNVGASNSVLGALPGDIKNLTPKDFLKQKQPRTDLERLICLAYYLTHARDLSQFTTRDITKLNGEAHGPNFTNAAATARNGVKQSRFLSQAGAGKKRITTLGEEVVEALPNAEKVREALATTRSRTVKRRKRTKKG